jgi:hypothetical protein
MQEPRFLNLVPIAAVLALAMWALELTDARQPPQWRRAGATLLAAVMVTQAFVGLRFFPVQVDFYGGLTPGLVRAMSWVRRQTPPASVIGVSPTRSDLVLGWWAEALTDRRILYATSPTWLNFADERRRARIADGIFDGRFPTDDTLGQAAAAEIDYLLVATPWPGYHSPRMASFIARHPGVVVFRDESALILRVGARAELQGAAFGAGAGVTAGR